MRTAVSTLFTFCPPAPPDRIVVISMSYIEMMQCHEQDREVAALYRDEGRL
jgi:hypothetical protein